MRPAALAALGLLSVAMPLSASAHADQKLIRLTTFPTVAMADGRSQITVSAEVRSLGGALVPDGTRVVLATTLGVFRENVVVTSGGLARGLLVSSSIPGVAKIT
ncbi:MAG: hypothetical protein C4320_04405, partial [Armatimonadota bacterium]